MHFERKELSNGIVLNYAHAERFKTDSLTLYFLLPIEKDTLSAVSLLPEVLRMGCETNPSARSMVVRTQELYDTALVFGQYHVGGVKLLSFSCEFVSDCFLPPRAGEKTDLLTEASLLLEDVLYRPLLDDGAFRADYTDIRRRAMIDALRARINRKTSYAVHRCKCVMCGEDSEAALLPYGTEDTVAAVTEQSLVKAYEKLLASARIECFYEGRADMARVEGALSFLAKHHEKDRTLPVLRVCEPPLKKREDVLRTSETVAAKQSKLVIGLRYKPLDTPLRASAFTLLMEILAYSPISKMFMRVREAHKLCYSCSAANDPMRGMLFLYAGIDDTAAPRAEKAMMAQVRAIGRRRVSEEEWHSAKQSVLSALRSLADTPDSLEMWYLRRHMRGFEGTLDDEIARIERVTLDEVAREARALAMDTVFLLRAGEATKEEGGEDE